MCVILFTTFHTYQSTVPTPKGLAVLAANHSPGLHCHDILFERLRFQRAQRNGHAARDKFAPTGGAYVGVPIF